MSCVTVRSPAQIRILAALAGVVTIVAGIAVRRLLPWGFWSKYSGVALWALVVYALVVFARPRAGVARGAAAALLISWAVEFAQLTPVPAWLSSKHAVLRMIFGADFSVGDLPAYAVGVLIGAGAHAKLVRRQPC